MSGGVVVHNKHSPVGLIIEFLCALIVATNHDTITFRARERHYNVTLCFPDMVSTENFYLREQRLYPALAEIYI